MEKSKPRLLCVYLHLGASPQLEYWSNGMMGELVLNEVEGKEFFTIKMVFFLPYPQYSNIPAFQYSIPMAQKGCH